MSTLQDASTPQEAMYHEALSAIRSGDRSRARDLLTRLLKTGQDNPEYWVWMSAVVETAKERSFCLKEALRLDPQNPVARRGLVLMGAMPPDSSQVFPPHFQKRNWQSKAEGTDQVKGKIPPKTQFALMGVAFLVVVGLIGFAIWGVEQQLSHSRRTYVSYPTNTAAAPSARTATPSPPAVVALAQSGSPTPLWMLLKATYTPTPLYISTPHAISEAYSIGMRAYNRGDWASAQNYLSQAVPVVKDSADVLYFLGEAYRQQGNYTQAIKTYNQVIAQNPDFAPAYLGRANAALAAKPKTLDSVIKDYQTAIKDDPKYGEAYLGLAQMQVITNKPKDALTTLNQAAAILPESPLVYLYRAQAYLTLEDVKQALENAQKANDLDITLLDTYRIIGASLQAQDDLQGSIKPLNTYAVYQPDDAEVWAMLGKAYLADDNQKDAQIALDKSLKLDNRQPDAYLLRGQILLEQKKADDALDDFRAALRFNSDSYEASLGIGEALMALNYPGDAYVQFEGTKALAKEDLQKAELLYWSAQSLEKLGELEVALRNYQALIGLPKNSAKPEWVAYAKERIGDLVTQTPTPVTKTPTPTPTVTRTRQPTATKISTATRQPTATHKPTATTHP